MEDKRFPELRLPEDRTLASRVIVSTGALSAAALSNIALGTLFLTEVQYILFHAAILFSAWWAGGKAGAVATVLSAYALWRPWDNAPFPFDSGLGSIGALIAFLFGGLVLSLMCSAMQHNLAASRRKARHAISRSEKLAADLDERVRQRTATLEEGKREMEAFTYSVSHDLRTPLQFVRSYAESIEHDPDNRLSGLSAERLARLIDAGARMEAIIHDLLGYSRLTQATMQPQAHSLDDTVADTIQQHRATIEETAARVEVAPDLPYVLADRVGLFQTLSNLLGNALKFARPGEAPVIQIDAVATSEFVRLRIADRGIGVPLEQRERIFHLFERLHGPDQYPGTGVGLALVKRAANRMGGKCGVEDNPGGGSCFWVDFPSVPATKKNDGIARVDLGAESGGAYNAPTIGHSPDGARPRPRLPLRA